MAYLVEKRQQWDPWSHFLSQRTGKIGLSLLPCNTIYWFNIRNSTACNIKYRNHQVRGSNGKPTNRIIVSFFIYQAIFIAMRSEGTRFKACLLVGVQNVFMNKVIWVLYFIGNNAHHGVHWMACMFSELAYLFLSRSEWKRRWGK